jgi:Rieske Fe-S protein
MSDSPHMNRREFVTIVTATLGTAIGATMSFVRTKVNGWEKTANSYGVFIIRGEGDEVKVLSNVCTHLSCRVNWDDALKEFKCPCHDAAFDINGGIIKGPQPRPLDVYEYKIEEGNLLIHFVEG